jgi:amino acid transporter
MASFQRTKPILTTFGDPQHLGTDTRMNYLGANVSEIQVQGSNRTAGTSPRAVEAEGGRAKLPTKMGTLALVFAVIAWVSPLAGSAGYLPLVIGYGNGIGAPLMFLVAGLILGLFAVGYTAMVRNVDRPGAFYTYIAAGLGKRIGLGAGGLTSAYQLLGGVTFYFFGGVVTSTMVNDYFGINLPWWLYLFTYLAIVTFCAYRGVDFSVKIIGVIVCLEVLIVMAFNIVTLIRGGATGYTAEPFTWNALTSGPLTVAILFAVQLYGGFESTAVYREDMREPNRSIPRATYIVVAVISLFYGVTAYCLILALGPDSVVAAAATDPSASMTTAIAWALGDSLTKIVGLLLVTSVLASQISIANGSARYLYSFGVDRVLPRVLATLHPRYGSPSRAVLAASTFSGAVVLLFIAIGTNPTEVFTVFTGVITFAFEALMLLVSASVIVYFRRHGHVGESKWIVLYAPLLSVMAFSSLLYLTAVNADLLFGTPTMLIPVMFGVLACFVVLGLIRACYLAVARPTDFARIGRNEPTAD